MKRVIERDSTERGKTKKQAEIDFSKSWDIYYEKIKNICIKKNTNEFIITRNTNIDQILIKIFN
jgi:uridine kinase